MTRSEDPSPDDYYAAMAKDADATAVKLADLAENTDADRMGQLPAETQTKLRTKYARAFRALGCDDLAIELQNRQSSRRAGTSAARSEFDTTEQMRFLALHRHGEAPHRQLVGV